MRHPRLTRRGLLGLGPGAAAWAFAAVNTLAENDPRNTKICHRINARGVTDGDLLFLKQIGLRWARLEFGEQDTPFEYLQATQQRFGRYGIKIYSGVHSAYRSPRVQLGRDGRDQDIETYRRFLRALGKLEIPVASYDFHPANTYTTSEVERRGYKTRVFDLEDLRGRVEKQAFDREYSAEDIWANYLRDGQRDGEHSGSA